MRMPVTIGQLVSAPYCRASFARIWFTVTSFRLGASRIAASTSSGRGMSMVPVPWSFCIFGGTGTILASCGFSSLARQEVREVNLPAITDSPIILPDFHDSVSGLKTGLDPRPRPLDG